MSKLTWICNKCQSKVERYYEFRSVIISETFIGCDNPSCEPKPEGFILVIEPRVDYGT